MFDDAIIPLARGTRDYEGRKYEAPVEQDEDEKARLAALLGDEVPEPAKEPEQAAEQEAEKAAEQEAEKAVKDVEAEKAAAEKAAAEKALAAASKFAPKKK